MKYFALLFSALTLAFTLSSCTHKKTIKNDLEALHYKGKVKSIAYNVSQAVERSGKIDKGSLISKVQSSCNQQGYFTEQSTFKNDKLNFRRVRLYDSLNNIIEEIMVQQAVVYLIPGGNKPDSMSESHTKYTYKTDEKGNHTEVKTMKDGKPWYRDENTYDANGNIIKLEEYVPWDTLNKREYYKYDDKNNLVEKKGYLPNGNLAFKYTYSYDDAGNITELVTYKRDSTVDSKEEMKYDAKRNKTADAKFMIDGTKAFDWRYEFTDFDKEGNWIKEISYSKDKPQAITERLIEYYK